MEELQAEKGKMIKGLKKGMLNMLNISKSFSDEDGPAAKPTSGAV
jgi:hypothetical protein